jgi:DTW domain-containing protein YfiP
MHMLFALAAALSPLPQSRLRPSRASRNIVETPRDLCPRCRRPPQLHGRKFCICSTLPSEPIALQHTRVLILQHPAESKKTIASVPLIPLCIQQFDVKKGNHFSASVVQQAVDEGFEPLLLFPGPGALALDAEVPNGQNAEDSNPQAPRDGQSFTASDPASPRKVCLVLIDGTWTQARHMVRHSPELAACCKHVMFEGEVEAIINPLRREPEQHCTSTLEACTRALRLVERTPQASAAADHMEAALRAIVNAQLSMVGSSPPRFVDRKQRTWNRKLFRSGPPTGGKAAATGSTRAGPPQMIDLAATGGDFMTTGGLMHEGGAASVASAASTRAESPQMAHSHAPLSEAELEVLPCGGGMPSLQALAATVPSAPEHTAKGATAGGYDANGHPTVWSAMHEGVPRVVWRRDTAKWLRAATDSNSGECDVALPPSFNIVSGLPDISEVRPKVSPPQYEAWCIEVVTRMMQLLPDDRVAIFYQTPGRYSGEDGSWLDKQYLVTAGARAAGALCVWQKIVLYQDSVGRKRGGTRAGFVTLLCFSKGHRVPRDHATVDVLSDRGHMAYSHATGEAACAAAIEYCLEAAERGAPTSDDASAAGPIVDPFCGYGSVLAVANAYGLPAIGLDVSLKCCAKAADHTASESLVEAQADRRRRTRAEAGASARAAAPERL